VQSGTDFRRRSEIRSEESPLLRIELLQDTAGGCLARMSGHLVSDTVAALWSIEPMMANEARVVLDLSGVVAIDSAGLEATVRLMDAIRTFGGRLTIGSEKSSVSLLAEATVPSTRRPWSSLHPPVQNEGR
jgi:ABC-type transporter Mla MlaB component